MSLVDKKRFGQIVNNYMDHFDVINDSEHEEYYKWQIAATFHDDMDKVLVMPTEDFAAGLSKVKKYCANFIDGVTQPFEGLCYFAKTEPETVRKLFLDLFKDDGGDLDIRMSKIRAFLNTSHALNEKYNDGGFRYENDLHSVTGYLFLYDPEHVYMFKASECEEMAKHVGFAGDWGTQKKFDIHIFYLFCDKLMKAIRDNQALLAKSEERFRPELQPMHPDKEKHILLFDIIYCVKVNYMNLCEEVEEDHFTTADHKKWYDLYMNAQEAEAKYLSAKKEADELQEALDWANGFLQVGAVVNVTGHGSGTVTANNGTQVTVQFESGSPVKYSTAVSVGRRLMAPENSDAYGRMIKVYAPVLQNGIEIKQRLRKAEGMLKECKDFLE